MSLLSQDKDDDYYMGEALREAGKALEQGEVPVGAVIVHQQKIIGRAWNQVELLRDPTAHAEMIAITQAAEYLQNWRLTDTTLYVTLECCPMCVGAIMLARIKRVCYGAPDFRLGSLRSLIDLPSEIKWDHTLEILPGIRAEESSQLLKEFFAAARQRAEKEK